MRNHLNSTPALARRLRRTLPWGLGAIVLAVLLAALWSWLLVPAGRINRRDPALLALGEQVYFGNCASCHGAKLEGQPNWRERNANGRLPAPPHDEAGHTWHHPDQVLFDIIKDGVQSVVPGYESDMPAFGALLSDEQIWAVLAFIEDAWPEHIQQSQQRITKQWEDQQ